MAHHDAPKEAPKEIKRPFPRIPNTLTVQLVRILRVKHVCSFDAGPKLASFINPLCTGYDTGSEIAIVAHCFRRKKAREEIKLKWARIKKELGQYSVILTSHLVNKPYTMFPGRARTQTALYENDVLPSPVNVLE